MRTQMYTLGKSDIERFQEKLPKYVIENSSKKGYFTLGAFGMDNTDKQLIGVVQFYINITADSKYVSEIVYIYVRSDYRSQGIGTRLLERVDRILKKSQVDINLVMLPESKDEMWSQDISIFFNENGYIFTEDRIPVWKGAWGSLMNEQKEQSMRKYVRFGW